MMGNIYFDYASTCPTDPRVIKAMEPYFYEKFGNPSSPHSFGREAAKVLEDCRQTVSRCLGAGQEEIIFTSGGTESNNHAIIGAARRLKNKGNHIIVNSIDHHSVLEPVKYLEKEGFQATYIKVDRSGLVDTDEIKQAMCEKTILVAVMHASNEIGTLQPVKEIGKLARDRGVLFHVDAVQAVGHIPVDVNELGVDLLSLSAHKFYGPKGAGALYIRKGTEVCPYLMGGDQEKDRRASTQNIPGIVGLARALELCQEKMSSESQEQTKLRNRIIKDVQEQIDGVILNGHPHQRLPNNAHFAFEKVQGEALLMSLDMIGIAASMGSACTSGALEPSHVLRSLGLSDELAYGALRISIGRWTTREHVDYLLEKLPEVVKRLRI